MMAQPTATNRHESLQAVVLEFLHDHFYLSEGLFEPVDEDSSVGNRRFGWHHYMIHNVEVALLVNNDNERFRDSYLLAASHGVVGIDSCFIEIFAPNFQISTVVVLQPYFKDSKLHPGTMVRQRTGAELQHVNFTGELNSALAYFTFAKLAK